MKIDTATLERQARCFVHPVLIGPEADGAVGAIVAWETVNPDAGRGVRERAWALIAQLAT